MRSYSLEFTTNTSTAFEEKPVENNLLFLLKNNMHREKLLEFVTQKNINEYELNDGFEFIYVPKYDNHLIVASANDLGKNQLGLYAGKPFESFEIVASYEGIELFPKGPAGDIKKSLEKYQGSGDYIWQIHVDNENILAIDALKKGSSGRFANFANSVNVRILCIDNAIYYMATKPIAFGEEICIHYGKDYFDDNNGKTPRIERKPAHLKNFLKQKFPHNHDSLDQINNMEKLETFLNDMQKIEEIKNSLINNLTVPVTKSDYPQQTQDNSIKKRKLDDETNISLNFFSQANLSHSILEQCFTLLMKAIKNNESTAQIDNLLQYNANAYTAIFDWNLALIQPKVFGKYVVNDQFISELYKHALNKKYTRLVGLLFEPKHLIKGTDDEKFRAIKALIRTGGSSAMRKLVNFKIDDQPALKWYIYFLDNQLKQLHLDQHYGLNALLNCNRDVVQKFLKSLPLSFITTLSDPIQNKLKAYVLSSGRPKTGNYETVLFLNDNSPLNDNSNEIENPKKKHK